MERGQKLNLIATHGFKTERTLQALRDAVRGINSGRKIFVFDIEFDKGYAVENRVPKIIK